MLKNDYVLCMNLHTELKERIKGKIFITINDGVMTVHIKPGRGLHYTQYINDNDLTRSKKIQYLADEIEYSYRRFITDNYFIRKEVKW